MQTFSFDQLLAAIVVFGAAVTAYNLISTAIKNAREQRAIKSTPINEVREAVRNHGEMLDRDKRRLDALEKSDRRLEDGINCLMRSNLSMTRHMLHGNNVDGLNDSEREITDFLTRRTNDEQ